MVLLVLLVPVYLFLPDLTPVRTFSRPELPLDRPSLCGRRGRWSTGRCMRS
jgi:hypothetical protein